jgi:S1-C subfamily serine protease
MQMKDIFRRGTWLLAAAWLGMAVPAWAQFAPEDEVRLRRDEMLEFRGTKFRQGKQGETFTVIQYDAVLGKVFVLATDSDGKPFALSVPDRSVELLPKDLATLMQKGAAALKQKDLATARTMFVKASAGQMAEKAAMDLAVRTDALQTVVTNLANARTVRERGMPEVQRLLKNAEVAGRPDPLFPNSRDHEVRAAEIREKAKQLQTRLDQGVELGETRFTEVMKEFAATTDRLVEAGYLTIAVDLRDGLQTFAALQMPKRPDAMPNFAWDQAEMARRSAAAAAWADKAQTEVKALHLHAAQAAVSKGLQAEAGRAELRQLKLRIDADLDRVKTSLLVIANLRETQNFDGALAEVEKVERLVTDSGPLAAAAKEIRQLLGEKGSAVSKARASEEAGNYLGALAVYDRYGLKADAGRVLATAAKMAENLGNFMLAHTLYGRAGLTADAARVAKQRDDQEFTYRGATMALAEGRFDDAIAIYNRFNDTDSRNQALVSRGRRLEAQGKYDEARAQFRQAEAEAELKRLSDWLDHRAQWLTEAARLEAAGDQEQAHRLFGRANAKAEMQRTALVLGKKSEATKDYALAADYFEQGGDYVKAAAMRTLAEKENRGAVMLESVEAVFRRCAPACVTVMANGRGAGSGFFVAKGGYVLTNRHVIEGGGKTLMIVTAGGERFPAELVATGGGTDLALLKAAISREHAFLLLANSDAIRTGEQVYAIGSPEGLPQVAAEGIISNIERDIRGNRCFQTSVSIHENNSGGPLLDNRGQVVGICTAGLGTAGGIGPRAERINFAIKANEAGALMGKVER